MLRAKLDSHYYSRIKRGVANQWEIETVLAVCAGLWLNRLEAEALLASAGYSLNATANPKYVIYAFMLAKYHGRPIQKWNDFLEPNGMPPLGSKQYNKAG
ncbi:MAG: hypothetical protein FWF69_05780 [Firmicutes bacterium]|nr:hypothetical protein [Bacillota bacterium]